MISFVDLHVIMALEQMWQATLDAGYDAFRAVFNSQLADSLFEDVWEKIGTANTLAFRSSWTTDVVTYSNNVIAVELAEEAVAEGFMDDAFLPRTTAGETLDQWNILLNSVVNIYIYSTDKDTLRVLHAWVMAALLASKTWILVAGGDGMFYEGAGDIGPERGLLPDGNNKYLRMQRWRFTAATHLTRPGGGVPITPKWITVADSRSLVGARRDADTHETVPFDDTLPGGLDPSER